MFVCLHTPTDEKKRLVCCARFPRSLFYMPGRNLEWSIIAAPQIRTGARGILLFVFRAFSFRGFLSKSKKNIFLYFSLLFLCQGAKIASLITLDFLLRYLTPSSHLSSPPSCDPRYNLPLFLSSHCSADQREIKNRLEARGRGNKCGLIWTLEEGDQSIGVARKWVQSVPRTRERKREDHALIIDYGWASYLARSA